jgi:hypothetical protein
MNLRIAAVVAGLALAGCSKSSELATIEEAETYAKVKGVVLTQKEEDTQQIVANRSYMYMAGQVHVHVFQFNSEKATAEWKRVSDETPLGQETIIAKGKVAFSVWGGTDAERQPVITALQ